MRFSNMVTASKASQVPKNTHIITRIMRDKFDRSLIARTVNICFESTGYLLVYPVLVQSILVHSLFVHPASITKPDNNALFLKWI